jgi:hypothetical protein
MYPYGRSQYCLVFSHGKLLRTYTHTVTVTHPLFLFFSVCLVCLFIVFCFMATFISPFSFHLLVVRQSMFASLGQILASVQPLIGSRPAIFDVKFPCLFENEILWQFSFENWFSPSDFGGWPFRNHSRISLTRVPNTVPADRSR